MFFGVTRRQASTRNLRQVMARLNYRAEIDGLRALAVLAVMLFHAELPGFGGGFVGVDVFFVISGYLIAGIINADVLNRRFSLYGFYARRARRILPALALVELAAIPAALLLLSPDDLKDFFQSVAASSLAVSNVLFWKETGYFDTQAALKPLLHTWSLAVEEQFYCVLPILFATVAAHRRRLLLPLLVGGAALSFLACQHSLASDSAFAFYMLPSRAWELLFGAGVALLPIGASSRPESAWHTRAASLLAVFGLGLIGWAVTSYDVTTPFPGKSALVPVVGAGLTLAFSQYPNPARWLLSQQPLVAIGLMSYSLYLWHNPLFVFARHAYVGEPPTTVRLALLVATFFLSFLSWRLVEQPFRNASSVNTNTFRVSAILAFALLLGIGLGGSLMPQGVERFRLAFLDERTRGMIRTKNSLLADRASTIKRFSSEQTAPFDDSKKRARLLILGDSVSEDLYTAIRLNSELSQCIEARRLALDESCMADAAKAIRVGLSTNDDRRASCDESSGNLLAHSLLQTADAIILCAHWSTYSTHSTHEGAMRLAETLAASGRRVFIVGIFAMQDASSIGFVAATRGLSPEAANQLAYRSIPRTKIDGPNHMAKSLASRCEGITYLDKRAVFVDETKATARLYGRGDELLFADNAHLTTAGLEFLGKCIASQGWFSARPSGGTSAAER